MLAVAELEVNSVEMAAAAEMTSTMALSSRWRSTSSCSAVQADSPDTLGRKYYILFRIWP